MRITATGTVTGSNGSFSVDGGHTYNDEGSAPVSVSITRTSDNANTTANGQVTVAEHDALTPQGTTINTFTNQTLNNVVVATFSDSDTANTASDFTASIDWGDGTTATGTVSSSGGSYTVTGSHTYTAPGTDNVHVTLSDDAPGTATATANSTVNVSAGTLASQEVLTSATEHVALGDGTTVATFTDTNPTDLASGFTATIDWGDGLTTTGTVTGSNGSFSVDGGHTYLDEASAPVSVSITRTSDNAHTTANGQVTVAENDALTAQGTTTDAFANQPLNNVVVATVSDSDTASPASDLPASIDWGDGTTSVGSVSGSNGSFTVTGSHAYTAPGTYAVDVAVSDDAPGTATATTSSTVIVSAGTLASQEVLTSATEHVALGDSTTVATFTDTNPYDLASGFAATIDWGDGITATGTVTGSNGSFSVDGGHTYLDEASAPVSVSITRTADNVNTTANGQVSVAEHDALTAQGTTINAVPNQALNNVTVATFSDSDTTTPASDLVASIDWGDGTTTGGSVSGSAGAFTVTGSHTYTAPGTDNVHVTLSDDTPGTATAIGELHGARSLAVNDTTPEIVVFDFDGDGKSDILWQNDNGQAQIWLMNGSTVLDMGLAGSNPGNDWLVKGAGDFNADGKADILWQNVNGQPMAWFMDGDERRASTHPHGRHAGILGNFGRLRVLVISNGDGNADILWQNVNGQPAILAYG